MARKMISILILSVILLSTPLAACAPAAPTPTPTMELQPFLDEDAPPLSEPILLADAVDTWLWDSDSRTLALQLQQWDAEVALAIGERFDLVGDMDQYQYLAEAFEFQAEESTLLFHLREDLGEYTDGEPYLVDDLLETIHRATEEGEVIFADPTDIAEAMAWAQEIIAIITADEQLGMLFPPEIFKITLEQTVAVASAGLLLPPSALYPTPPANPDDKDEGKGFLVRILEGKKLFDLKDSPTGKKPDIPKDFGTQFWEKKKPTKLFSFDLSGVERGKPTVNVGFTTGHVKVRLGSSLSDKLLPTGNARICVQGQGFKVASHVSGLDPTAKTIAEMGANVRMGRVKGLLKLEEVDLKANQAKKATFSFPNMGGFGVEINARNVKLSGGGSLFADKYTLTLKPSKPHLSTIIMEYFPKDNNFKVGYTGPELSVKGGPTGGEVTFRLYRDTWLHLQFEKNKGVIFNLGNEKLNLSGSFVDRDTFWAKLMVGALPGLSIGPQFEKVEGRGEWSMFFSIDPFWLFGALFAPEKSRVVVSDPEGDTRDEYTGQKVSKPPIDVKEVIGEKKSFDWTIELAGEVPTPPEWPTLYQIVLDRNNDPSDNDNRPDAGVFNGDLIYVVEFYPEVGYWELRRFDYDAQTVTWDEIPTEGTFSIEANFVCISIPESEIKLTSTQEALPFRVVTETETHETLFWDAAPDEDRAVLPIIPPADTETK